MKWDQALKVSGLSTELKLMVTCKARKITKKRPESAITTFRAMDDLANPLIRVGF